MPQAYPPYYIYRRRFSPFQEMSCVLFVLRQFHFQKSRTSLCDSFVKKVYYIYAISICSAG